MSAERKSSNSKDFQISIVVPTRNEAENVQPLLDRLATAMEGFRFEVLFVDDSNDGTARKILSLINQYPFDVRIIARPAERRNGLSGAVVEGFSMAEGDWVCVMDADLQHPPETIPLMWDQAKKSGADLIVGSRRGDLFGPFGLTRLRAFNSKTLTILARMLFPRLLKNVSDPLTGLFLVRRSAVDATTLRPDGFKILLEILVRCPALHVSEVHFDFAPRYDGQSKADVREGIRFFRHLVRLRLTVNPHLYRFVVVVLVGIVGNSALLYLMRERVGLSTLLSTVLAAEALALWNFFLFTFWVFSERENRNNRRQFLGDFLLTQIFLIFIHLPLMWLLLASGWFDYLTANLAALIVVSLVRYSLSEQWVWTKSGVAWQQEIHYYNIHDILFLESHVPFAELSFFATTTPTGSPDIQIRLDRQGTPSALPGGISYDERLGRFGFGLSVLAADLTQVVASPLLGRSPNFFYTNIIEPILRWRLVHKGYAFIQGATAARESAALVISSTLDMGALMSDLCTQYGFDFLADELSIVDAQGQVYCYPKPVTIVDSLITGQSRREKFPSRLLLWGRRLLYTRFLRGVGLWLSAHDLPAATLNTYLQWLVPQPKFMLGELVEGLTYKNQAAVTQIIWLNSDGSTPRLAGEKTAELQQDPQPAGFQPLPLLVEQLRYWQENDLLQAEETIINLAIQSAGECDFQITGGKLPAGLAAEIAQIHPSAATTNTQNRPNQTYQFRSESQGEPRII